MCNQCLTVRRVLCQAKTAVHNVSSEPLTAVFSFYMYIKALSKSNLDQKWLKDVCLWFTPIKRFAEHSPDTRKIIRLFLAGIGRLVLVPECLIPVDSDQDVGSTC